ncbi:MAG: hypothetical protein EAZ42_09275 [Verrucomicrobia bacterium]|nr:MAG: hypothetical protein EAZ42_09275 [Verrucomicrobiota bacterium]
MAILEAWHVRSRGRECAVTQRAFIEGEIIITALLPDPASSGYLRRDFSQDGWSEFSSGESDIFSFWKTQFTQAAQNHEQDPLRKLSPEALLRRLIEEEDEHTENTRYILSVMLERQKILRETDQQPTNSGILRVYEHRKTGEVFLIKDPNVPLSEVEKLQEEVFSMLNSQGASPPIDESISQSPQAASDLASPSGE